VRNGKKVEAVILMHITVSLKTLTLILLICLAYFIAVSIAVYALHPPGEMLDALLISSQIAVAVGTIFLAYMTARSVEELKVEGELQSYSQGVA